MLKILSIVLLSFVLGLISVNPALATDDFTFTINSLSEFEEGQFPFVYGKAITLNNNPVSEVQIQVNFPSEKIKTSTNSTGQFHVSSTIPAEIGEHTITIYAKKDNKFAENDITYHVLEHIPIKSSTITNPIKQSSKVTDENIELDPFSKMIKHIEEQNKKEIKKKERAKEQQEITEKRIQVEAKLQKDLKDSEKRNEYHSPRNAFYRFIQEIDNSVRGIFWQQFLFTEHITEQARDAKENALEEGKSSAEAMKIFQEEAVVTQKEVIEFNKNLSINFGNATSDIQEQFDEYGKIPREE